MKTLCITLGDPCGLGPELVARHFADSPPVDERILLLGPASALERAARRYNSPVSFTVLDNPADVRDKGCGLYLYEAPGLAEFDFPSGEACVNGGRAAGISLNSAVDVLKAGVAHGLLTCPLNKAMLQDAGFDFPGHTEFLAEKLGVGRENVCMHLCGHDPEDDSPKLRVSLVTTHPPLADVPRLVTGERILHCLRLTAGFLRTLGLDGPIGVCGLNPHAGENGLMGDEEQRLIEPAIDLAMSSGMQASGPYPADTIYNAAVAGKYDLVVAMYHDQGLIPVKLLERDLAVNVTLGLPTVRTSPDHGTAFDIAGKGIAHPGSMGNAIDLAVRMSTPSASETQQVSRN